ncbi:amidase domain-containing protein [Aneurinibacillus sp. Ricciae_BoGa-3]|uniref:amidase domain-containing protein n=1 Tax=Aneurinibacillus sp. Ricciae_BoGa-3 TaxID=3022697 RepID=UPI00234041B0|nr:amidase domain-containing protein [Aneurinibacillus sp. Ricciae_BoGa-3]WCK54972.1 amidase domain-containing protein [Aneurinibacillus sp. Ricciae_BoGa-3]
MRRWISQCTRFLLAYMLLISLLVQPVYAVNKGQEQGQGKEEVKAFLNMLYATRTKFLITNQPETIAKFYMKTRASGYALEQEKRRTNYIHAWGEKRALRFNDASSSIRIFRLDVKGDRAKAYLHESLCLSYVYPGKNLPPQKMGIGTRHSISLQKVDGSWRVLREWYLDPIDEDTRYIPTEPSEQKTDQSTAAAPQAIPVKKSGQSRYNREKAVEYANKYAGAAWGAGNNHLYNKKYKDYTYLGGDCTNFSSQVLGDKEEGGGLPMGRGWHYYSGAGGSVAWVQTDGLKNFLLYSGYGRLIGRGYYESMVKPTEKYPHGAVAELQPGDLIGYEMKNGDVDHFSVVVGKDDNGYPLVNSHTGDRYRVPWDIGWDKKTRFWLIHIRD